MPHIRELRGFISRSTGLPVALLAVFFGGALLISQLGAQPTPTPSGPNLLVRGYIAVRIGGTDERFAEVTSRAITRHQIYLPEVTVFLRDPASGVRSESAITDLSGRFNVHAPSAGRYNICWKSPIYGDGCDKSLVASGARAVFVSSIFIPIKRERDSTVVFGNVRLRDGSLPRIFEPAADLNSFASVAVQDANRNPLFKVAVNNFGDYLIPSLPFKQPVHLVASIEKAELVQMILPEARLDTAPLHRIDLELRNSRPLLGSIVPLRGGAGQVVKVASPNDDVDLKAEARDADGDSVRVHWIVEPSSGSVSATQGAAIKWQLPATAGLYSVTVIARDERGGYDRKKVSVLVDAAGVPFTGVVVDNSGKLVAKATVEVNGNVTQTNTDGYFKLNVPSSAQFVLNIRGDGYGFYSKVYNGAITGGRWSLTRATVASVNPSRTIKLANRRSREDCPGPKSAKLDWKRYAKLLKPVWFDQKGNVIAPPREVKQRPILPTQLKRGECGPGISVIIPPNSLVDENGQAPAGNVNVSLSTVDLMSPEQMPGDETVRTPNGPSGYMQSWGAGSVEIIAAGKRYNLKPGAEATVRIPVDPSQLATGASLPAKIPLLFYDEKQGSWYQEGTLKLVGTGAARAYEGKVKHFSTINSDLVKQNQACVAFQSPTLGNSYDLEITIPMNNVPGSPPGTAPRVITRTIDNVTQQEHVLYNLPSDTNITLVPIRTGANPTPIGVFIVNTGQPQSPQTPNLPVPDANGHYTACSTALVTLSELVIPGAPNSPHEFLQGLNLTGLNAVSETTQPLKFADMLVAAQQYKATIDRLNKRKTLLDFKKTNGFVDAAGVPLPGEIASVYANGGDLGFGREMHCRTNVASDGLTDVACYVTNWGSIDTDDLDDVLAATLKSQVGLSSRIATVAMEYSRIENALGSNPAFDPDRVVKFYVYNGADNEVFAADLDGKGARPVPQLCMVCHGGAMPTPNPGGTGVPSFGNNADVKFGSRFLPFDLRFFRFLSPGHKSGQQAAFKQLNENIVRIAPPVSSSDNVIAEVIGEMYGGGVADQKENFSVPGWRAPAAPEPAKENFYKAVVAPACRTCHIALPFQELKFKTAGEFIDKLGVAETRVCTQHVMPHAKRTHDIFWTSFAPSMPAQLDGFGETFKNVVTSQGQPNGWAGNKCGPFTPGGTTPLSFYKQNVQPIWDNNCSGCHIGSAFGTLSLAAPGSHGNLVNVPATKPGAIRVIPNNVAGSYVVQKLNGAAGINGVRMPQGCAGDPTLCLGAGDMGTISTWITAPNNAAP